MLLIIELVSEHRRIMWTIVIVLSCITAAYATVHISVHDCGSHGAHINSIVVDQCQQEPCVVHKGQEYTVHVNFTATKTFQQAHNLLHGGLGFIQVAFPVNPENACGTNVQCPILAGQTYMYSNTMTCPDYAPTIKVTGKWEVKDEHHQDIFCFSSTIQIAS